MAKALIIAEKPSLGRSIVSALQWWKNEKFERQGKDRNTWLESDNYTWQETCNRSDSAAIFPHRPEDGGSNIVADNELETLTSVSVGSTAYVITPSGQQINYVCVDAFDGHNDVTGYDALQKDDGTIVWGSAELIVSRPIPPPL